METEDVAKPSEWQKVCEVFANTDTITAIAELYMERNIGRPRRVIQWEEALREATATFNRVKSLEPAILRMRGGE